MTCQLADFELPGFCCRFVGLDHVVINLNQLGAQFITGLDVRHNVRIGQHLLDHLGHQIFAGLHFLPDGPIVRIQLVLVGLLLTFLDNVTLDVFQFAEFVLHPFEHVFHLANFSSGIGQPGFV